MYLSRYALVMIALFIFTMVQVTGQPVTNRKCTPEPANDEECQGTSACDGQNCKTYTYTPACKNCRPNPGTSCTFITLYTSQKTVNHGKCEIANPYGAQCVCATTLSDPPVTVNCRC